MLFPAQQAAAGAAQRRRGGGGGVKEKVQAQQRRKAAEMIAAKDGAATPTSDSSSARTANPAPATHSGAGPAASQGGAGSGGRGGWVHVSDQRNPPDWGRIAYPEDIFGSVEVDGEGKFVGENGGYQEGGAYRICTRDGILGLSTFLRGKVVEALEGLEKSAEGKGR